MSVSEEVILLDDEGQATGTASKLNVHNTDTPLHLAFSCHVVNASGEVLVTRRAIEKLTWPGVWTNSFCGHPQPGEEMVAAVLRRASFELGLDISDISLVLPDFRYRAVDASGIVENEICPVFIAHADTEPRPNPQEVVDYRWVSPADLASSLHATPWMFSPWLVLQAQQLDLFTHARSHAGAS
ncbi:isopentenyl-diphosphate delta-isomerase [Microbacterium halimionae]|uniref:Isopentenyl-diphosphate Delta-isomerase n=1 Tax=Microbacterium halimionae TaxID=1526413 RepID=A0A7W3JR00_9MICO|nr:isopentenyl-diphosphate Delta-isomerase [Microbacterium halimionae]MBA8817343.1 isopentenyl-diphosphate delta-isomerase [Microbacterium halimionae]NII95977.1 isopentenyl-diphosphate delta-isomerase [Microbacterium halimionae]